MPHYHAPIQDMMFLWQDCFGLSERLGVLGAEVTSDLVAAVLEQAGKFSEEVLLPLNQSGDAVGCIFEDGNVTTPPGFREAYQRFCEGGWPTLIAATEHGGQSLPHSLNILVEEMFCASNLSFSLYPVLTRGAYHALKHHPAEQTQSHILPKLASGQWSGVMCLTEPHCGTDLGLVRTRAKPAANGGYTIEGSKIFVTGGEQDLTENIVYLLLARLPDAPDGVRGLSLFLTSKYTLTEDGELGARNALSCGAIEHKMGIRGSVTAVINFDGAKAELIGEPHKGLAAMFVMMNTERLAIGLEGLGQGDIAYQNASQYARERLQGRAPSGALFPEQAADPLLVHPDVRRMLLHMRAYNEGLRALGVWIAMQVDLSERHPEEAIREQHHDMVALFTPMYKAFATDKGFEVCNLGLQVFGGHGYICEWGMEQYVRDVRIAQIYEGANGIQALDLLKRKHIAVKGAYLDAYLRLARKELEAIISPEFSEYKAEVARGLMLLKEVGDAILTLSATDATVDGARAYHFLNLFGHVALAWLWLMQLHALGEREDDFARAKCCVADFYFTQILTNIDGLYQTAMSSHAATMNMPMEYF